MSLFDLARPVLFALEPEKAHALTIAALRTGLLRAPRTFGANRLATQAFGLEFPNPVGLAAGFDKHAEVPCAMLGLGLGFVEAGTVTPRPQPGNPRPRIFRLREDEAVINRFGFNSVGHDRFAANLSRQRRACRGIVGVNIGANKDSGDPIEDYVAGISRFADMADYLVVNISSPNTPGLRDLQRKEHFAKLLGRVQDARQAARRRPPLLVKIAPDLDESELGAIVDTACETGMDGLIVSNTTIDRPSSLRAAQAGETGGLSGRPLFEKSTAMLRAAYRLSGGKLPLVGVGGISSGDDAYAKIRAGATLVQLYTALVYQGPALITRIGARLEELLARDGLSRIADVVGADVR
jgi:dihydroorotate dehydrogenase